MWNKRKNFFNLTSPNRNVHEGMDDDDGKKFSPESGKEHDESCFDVEVWKVYWLKQQEISLNNAQHSIILYRHILFYLSSFALFIQPPLFFAITLYLFPLNDVENEKSTFDILKLNKLQQRKAFS